jgi:hypothetical protein
MENVLAPDWRIYWAVIKNSGEDVFFYKANILPLTS